MPNPLLDHIDRDLLDRVQRDCQQTLRRLAADVGISAPTCLRRLRRLARERVIIGYGARVDAERAGFGVRAYVEVSLRDPSGAHVGAFMRGLQRFPEVLHCAELAGHVDFMLTVVARDMPEFKDFARKALADDQQVRKYRSMLVLQESKSSPLLPKLASERTRRLRRD